MTATYLIVVQKAWMSDTGDGVDYSWDGTVYPDRAMAVVDGLEMLGHDDFNIATVADGRIVAFGHDMVDFDDADGEPHGGHDLDAIGRQIGLTTHEVGR